MQQLILRRKANKIHSIRNFYPELFVGYGQDEGEKGLELFVACLAKCAFD